MLFRSARLGTASYKLINIEGKTKFVFELLINLIVVLSSITLAQAQSMPSRPNNQLIFAKGEQALSTQLPSSSARSSPTPN